tara:strand:- start:7274 stop:7492 length:219 start_codon:yes stop_codon:yes gene_type:complete
MLGCAEIWKTFQLVLYERGFSGEKEFIKIENQRNLRTFATVFEINFKRLLLRAMRRLKDCITFKLEKNVFDF